MNIDDLITHLVNEINKHQYNEQKYFKYQLYDLAYYSKGHKEACRKILNYIIDLEEKTH